jgi:predicted metal-binding protein
LAEIDVADVKRDSSTTTLHGRPIVALCAGKDCRKRCEFAKVRDTLSKKCDVVDLTCVGICSGPVVVAHADSDEPRVFAKLRTKEHRKALLRVVGGHEPDARLVKLEVKNAKKKATLRKVRRTVA